MFHSAGLPELRLSHTMPQARERDRPVSSRGRAPPSRASIRSTALGVTLSILAPSATVTNGLDKNRSTNLGSFELLRHRAVTRFISLRARINRSRSLDPSAAVLDARSRALCSQKPRSYLSC